MTNMDPFVLKRYAPPMVAWFSIGLLMVFFPKYYFLVLQSTSLSHTLSLTHTFFSQVPEEEKNAGPRDRLVHVYHFFKDNHVCVFKHFELEGSFYPTN